MKALYFFFLFSLSYALSLAQFPGGVSTNLRGWYNGNLGVTLTGGVVSQWSDQSGNNLHATQTSATSRPAQNTTGFNYNTSITFDGQDNLLNVPDLMATTPTGVSVFGVARQTATNRDTWGCVILGQANGPAWTGGGYGLTALTAGNTSFGFWVRDYSANVVARATTLSEPSLMSGIWNGTIANSVQYFHDGTSQGTDTYNPGSVGDNGATHIGSGFGTGTEYCFYGDIAEVIVYNTGLSTANVSKINSYLAIKYGITLSSGYVNSGGTTVFTPAAPYVNDIIGIGRDNNSILYQKQSKNYDDSVRIFVSTLAASNSANIGTITNDQYVVIGANTGRLSGVLAEKPAGIYSRLQREWKVSNTNFSSTFNFSVKLNSRAVPSSVNTADLRLLVDDDGDFSNATVYSSADGLTFSYSNPLITVQNISAAMIPSGVVKYMTIGSGSSSTPLPIELLNFEAFTCGSDVCVNWETASEKDNERFEIERSEDGKAWEKIREVKGAGNSATKLSYSETDGEPLNGVSYYRIKQIDREGGFSYSPVAFVDFTVPEDSDISLYPNPSDGYIMLKDVVHNGLPDFSLINALGENVTRHITISPVPGEGYKLNISSLQEGIYYLQIISQDNTAGKAVKLIIKH